MGNDIIGRQFWIRDIVDSLRSGQTTQMIVGLGETDSEALKTAEWEYRNLDLRRVYYSPYRPVGHRDLPKEGPSPHRAGMLYRADALMRIYGWTMRKLDAAFGEDDNLLRKDPKLIVAHEELTGPIDPLEATAEELMQVPGIGPMTADRIVSSEYTPSSWREMRMLGVAESARPFLRIGNTWQTTWKKWT